MGFLEVSISEKGLCLLNWTLGLLSMAGLVFSLALVWLAVFAKRSVCDLLAAATARWASTAPHTSIALAALSAMLHLAGCCVAVVACRRRWVPGTRSLLLGYGFASLALATCCVLGMAACALHWAHLSSGLHADIAAAMAKYGNDLAVKAALDRMQAGLQCCGARSHREWFHLHWLRLPPGVTPAAGGTARADVPFSCCARDAAGRCVHHGLSLGRAGSLWRAGCGEAALRAAAPPLRTLLLLAAALVATQVAGGATARLLQTGLGVGRRGAGRRKAWLLGAPGPRPVPEESRPLLGQGEALARLSTQQNSLFRTTIGK